VNAAGGPASPEAGDARLIARVRRRLVLWSGGITLVILVILGVAIYVTAAWSLGRDSTAALQDRAGRIAALVTRTPDVPFRPGDDTPLGPGFGGPTAGTIAIIVGPDGTVYGPRDIQIAGLPNVNAVSAAQTSGQPDVRNARVAGTPVRVFSEPVPVAGGTYVIQVIGDRSGEVSTLNTLLGVLLIGGILALALAVFGGAIYADRALVPIRVSMRRQREFAADASHELRTPLAVIRGSVEHLQRHPEATIGSVGSALEDIDHEVGHLTELVDELLLLARADSGAVELERVPLDLADVTAGALAGLTRVAEEHAVRLEFDAAPVTVVGDPTRLRQLVTILADNAIRLSPAGGRVSVSVADERGRARMTVDDEGPGIAPEDRDRVFERFWRASGAPEGGSGLGLSIAKWIVDRHDGQIAAESAPGGGARFVVSLPATP
jgi:signal transduction histidine kinase